MPLTLDYQLLSAMYPQIPKEVIELIATDSNSESDMHDTLLNISSDESILELYISQAASTVLDPEINVYYETMVSILCENNFHFEPESVLKIIKEHYPNKDLIKSEIKSQIIERQPKKRVVVKVNSGEKSMKHTIIDNRMEFMVPKLPPQRTTTHHRVEVDYHGYKLMDAIDDAIRRFDDAVRNRRAIVFDFVTGKGNHSAQGYSVIKKNLMKEFDKKGVSWSFNEKGDGILVSTKKFV